MKEGNNRLGKLSPENSSELVKLLDNSARVGKITTDQFGNYIALAADDKTYSNVKDVLRTMPSQPELLNGVMKPALIKLTQKSYDELYSLHPGGMREVRNLSPDIYQAKFFEKHGRFPAI